MGLYTCMTVFIIKEVCKGCMCDYVRVCLTVWIVSQWKGKGMRVCWYFHSFNHHCICCLCICFCGTVYKETEEEEDFVGVFTYVPPLN